jgi:hypothetical protein
MKPSEQEKLLTHILPGEDGADFERASLEHGLSYLRRQRRRGHLLRAGGLAAVVGLIAAAFVLKSHQHSPRGGGSNAQLASTPSAANSSRVEFINDDQLLALFPGRSVALIGKPGEQRLVFLDKPNNHTVRAPF